MNLRMSMWIYACECELMHMSVENVSNPSQGTSKPPVTRFLRKFSAKKFPNLRTPSRFFSEFFWRVRHALRKKNAPVPSLFSEKNEKKRKKRGGGGKKRKKNAPLPSLFAGKNEKKTKKTWGGAEKNGKNGGGFQGLLRALQGLLKALQSLLRALQGL